MTMTPLKALKQAVSALKKRPCTYCLIGGHAASLYRSQERFTKDVDFALVANPVSRSREVAEQVIEDIGLRPVVGFIPPVEGEKKRNSVCMITSTPVKGALTGIIDILLPELPWILPAVARSQHNLIDVGFAAVPVITPEDLIIAKCFALRNSPDRFQDLDDLKALFTDVKDLDLDYLRNKLNELSLVIPEQVRKYAPASLRRSM